MNIRYKSNSKLKGSFSLHDLIFRIMIPNYKIIGAVVSEKNQGRQKDSIFLIRFRIFVVLRSRFAQIGDSIEFLISQLFYISLIV